MNAYKNKITKASKIEVCVVDVPQLSSWYQGVIEGQDVRDRLAVSGSSLTRGSFGSAMGGLRSEIAANDASPVIQKLASVTD